MCDWFDLQSRTTRGTRFAFFSSLCNEETHPSALKELVLCSLNVLLLAAPCSQHWSLQSTSVWEGQSPWSLRLVIDGVQVDGSFLLRLTARQECNSWKRLRNEFKNIKNHMRAYREQQLELYDAKLWRWPKQSARLLVGFPWIPYQQCTCWAWAKFLPSRHGGRSMPCRRQPRRPRWPSGSDRDRDHHRARSRVRRSERCAVTDRLKHSEPTRWRSPRWLGSWACSCRSSIRNATWRSRSRPSCTGRSVQPSCQDLYRGDSRFEFIVFIIRKMSRFNNFVFAFVYFRGSWIF